MEDLHSKIQLSSEDLRYIISNLMTAAKEKLDLHLPNPGTQDKDNEDPMRERVNELVNEFILETFELTKHSLIVDGIPMSSAQSLKTHLNQPNELIDPYDTELNEELRTVFQQVDEETLRVTQMRRNVPQELAESYQLITEEEARLLHQKQPSIDDMDDVDEQVGLQLPNLFTKDSDTDLKAEFITTLQLVNDIRNRRGPRTMEKLLNLENTIDFLSVG
ncbi:hypothetical protein NADFUDRAFT_66985 [Nadsonia fulvescens var. elongata DSM 6958]|uniref:Mis14-domain-containing protein n=1 Tax=Nadsonia fulvescens var. elongata DSM 6958 TaxID=857566 RepID=A0A1E3PH91_9ASCO|nr:hypothetical protein NADFUDRAFT_66985 [Nadsonia fulvescens var. elongata DSM 6958]